MTDHHLDAFVESPVRGNAHAGFGGRRRGNHRPQGRHGASPPTRLQPCSYGFRPGRRAQDAIAEIHQLTSRSYEWIVEADIEACFDSLDHTALTGRVRTRIEDRRVLRLVKAFLKAGIMDEQGDLEETRTGTPQGGILTAPTQ